MRVIHISSEFGEASGVGTFVRRLDDELRRRGVDSRVLVPSDLPLPDGAPASDTVLHIHGLWLRHLHAASVWARRNGVPVIWSTHGMTSPWSMRHKRWKKLPAWLLYQKRDLRSAALVHCTTETEVDWNRRLGLASTFIAPLGADLPPLAATGTASSRTILFVGRIHPVKALDRLIRAFALATRGRTDGWKLRIVGPDEVGRLAELKRLAQDLPVEFVGPKFGPDLAAEYERCDALALVSHTENFGATVVDAMAHGKPVITSVNTPWKLVRGTCGWWVENDPDSLAQALDEMMSLPEAERAAMGDRARKIVEERYTWSAVIDRMLSAYARVKS